MKPIRMTEEAEIEILKQCFDKFKKELDNFNFNINETKLNISFNVSEVAKERITILFTQNAYIKMQALVDFYDTEVGWYGMVEKINDRLYRVYDVKVCKQYVNGSKVDTDDDDTLQFFNSLTDEEAEHMHFQAHSHVRMSTSASPVDLQNQADVVHNLGKTGFYIFQIWNKNGDISTYLYDIDANMYYDSKDVVIDIETEDATVSEFLDSTLDLVIEKKYYPYQEPKGKKGKKEETSPATYNNWNNYCTYGNGEGWDW